MYFFIDESGDPTFYNKKGECIVGREGCSRILLLGFIKTEDPEHIRRELTSLRKEIIGDEYLKDIPSINKSMISFHAKDDCPEVRERVYKTIKELNFKAQFVVTRKKDENIFYNEVITRLLENKIHQNNNVIYFSKRGNRNKQKLLEQAVQLAMINFESKHKMKVETDSKIYVQVPTAEVCLEVIDYMNWAVQRAFIMRDVRYFNFLKDRISFIWDIYDFENYPKNYYNRRNQFNVNKISPLQLGSDERTA